MLTASDCPEHSPCALVARSSSGIVALNRSIHAAGAFHNPCIGSIFHVPRFARSNTASRVGGRRVLLLRHPETVPVTMLARPNDFQGRM